MAELGSLALLIALVLCAYSLVVGVVALLKKGEAADRLSETARRAGIAAFAAVFLASLILVTSAFRDDFSIEYIREHSNIALPIPYKFATLWSGQEGSLLFWALLLSTYGLVLRLRHKTDSKLFAYASVVIAAVQVFFLLLIIFPASPFSLTAGEVPADGNGLNPLLQYPEMVIHPPMLYLGYVGFTVPFAFALGALIMRYPGEKWIHITRRWTMVTWGFLTCGIFLGSHWAYSVLGWGGYWGWDPVENASLMPWLTGTAFLHSVMMQEKRGMLKVWNMWLVFITFWLAILGTYLTRSGVISSVHAFAQSAIGAWFLWFLVITLAVFTVIFFLNQSHLRSEHKLESMISRESSFLFNNLLLVVACITILVGTWFPLLYEFVAGSKVTVGGPYYNLVAIPVALLLLLLTAVGPLLAWRKTSLDSLKRNFLWPTCGALVVGVVMALAGVHFWTNTGYLFAWLAGMMATLVMLTVASEYIRGARVIARHTGQKLFASMIHLWHRNTRRYGGYIVHFGVAVVVIGILGTPLNQDKEKEMGYGDQMTLGPYTLVCRSYTQEENQNYSTEWAIMDVLRDGKLITTLYPERRVYLAMGQPMTMPQIYPTWKQDFLMVRDLYLVYEGQNPDTRRPIIKAHLNPLVPWIWIGWLIMVVGTISCLIPNAQPVRVTAPARVEPVAVAVGD